MFMWWESMDIVSQVFTCIAVPATVILLIQTILMFIGIGSETDGPDGIIPDDAVADGDGSDFDFDGMDSLHIFTVRGIIAFFVVFGWVGLAMNSTAAPLWVTIPVAAVSGAAMMLLLALLLKAVLKLRSGGNIDNNNALGTSGTVYLTVPPLRSGVGKVNVLLQGSYVERDAVTDEEEPIPTGSEIVVTGVSGQTALVVRRK